jgi:hemerythrin
MSQTRLGHHLLVAVHQIDSEHGEVVAQANRFSAAVDAGVPRAELEIRLTQLIERFQNHFDSEEAMMRSSSYTGLKAHSAEHRKLMEQISGLRAGLGSGRVKLCDALGLFMRLWTEQHITGEDLDFANFLHEGEDPCGTGLFSIGQ